MRIQENILAKRERYLLNWLCAYMPESVTPDQLTAVGVVGAAIVFVGYFGSRFHPGFLWLSVFGFVLNWLGDSLDGSLARYRRIERPRYGYFLDHSADAISILLIMAGLGLSGHVRLDVALFAVLGYFMLCIYAFLRNHVTGHFQLTYLSLGPTEMRIGLISLTGMIYFAGDRKFEVGAETFTSYDLIVLANGTILVILFVTNMLKVVRLLRREDSRPINRETMLKRLDVPAQSRYVA